MPIPLCDGCYLREGQTKLRTFGELTEELVKSSQIRRISIITIDMEEF